MGFSDELEAELPDDTEKLRARIDTVTKERNQARSAMAKTERDNERLQKIADFATQPLSPPQWLGPRKKDIEHRATMCALMSDTHFTEYVNPAEIDGYNAYSMDIAEARLERFFTGILKLSRSYYAGVKYDGCVLFSGGDLLSGGIHDLNETNEDTQLAGALRWSECITTGVGMLADEYGKVHVPWTVGNHGRLTIKERTKRRVRDNLDWQIGEMVAREFKNDDRVTFQIPESINVPVQIYETKFLMNHGQTGGGGGVGGIWPPIMKLKLRKMEHYDFDHLVIGHWHQYIMAQDQGLIVNGSLKGYDEFAISKAFRPERPQQATWLVTPENGITMAAPVLVGNRESEGW